MRRSLLLPKLSDAFVETLLDSQPHTFVIRTHSVKGVVKTQIHGSFTTESGQTMLKLIWLRIGAQNSPKISSLESRHKPAMGILQCITPPKNTEEPLNTTNSRVKTIDTHLHSPVPPFCRSSRKASYSALRPPTVSTAICFSSRMYNTT
jgi:hypothetical protein